MPRTLAFVLCLTTTASADDWPRWRGADGSGVSRETGWRPESLARPKVAFRAQLGDGLASLAVVGGRLYTAGNAGGQDVVWCLDAATGKPAWRHAYRCPEGNFFGPRATPTVDGGLVYAISRNGQAFCLDAATGEVRWQADLQADFGARPGDYGVSGSPLVAGEVVVYNAASRGIGLDRRTGKKVWAGPAGTSGFASPVAFEHEGKPAVALFTVAGLSIVDPATGRESTSFSWKTSFDCNAADPVVFDGKIFLTSGWDRGCVMLALGGNRLTASWQNAELRSQFATPVLLDGHLYGIDDNTPNGALRCVDAKTGATKWTRKGGFGNVLGAGNRILSIDRYGVLVVVEADPAACKEVVKTPVLGSKAKNWLAPVLSGGILYCRDSDGVLIALDVR